MYKLLFLFLIITIVNANDDGQYRPGKYGNEGRYVHSDEGKYVHEKDSQGSDLRIISPPNKSFGSFRSAGSSSSFAPKTQSSKSFNQFASPRSDSQFINRFIVDTASSNIAPFRQSPITAAESRSFGVQRSNEPNVRILKQDVEVNPDSYRYVYETENEIRAEEEGRLVNVNSQNEGIAVTGYYEYVGPDNVRYRVQYIADENGFQPIGDHLPTPPPIPAEIQTLLKNIGKK